MTWEIKSKKTIKLHNQNRFTITYEQLDFFSEEFQNSLDNSDCVAESEQFAEDLMAVLGDHLSRRNLQDIINVCERKLEEWG